MKIIYLLLAVFALESAALSQDDEVSANCPNDLPYTTAMKFFNGTCYQFVSQEMYWPQARNFCLPNGGRLVKVNDPQTNQFIVDSLNALRWRNKGVWIGLNDITTEMQWQWTGYERHPNEPLQWSNWARGHPGAFLHSRRDCVRMIRGSGDWKWHETLCSTLGWRYRFICEYSNTDNAAASLASNENNKRSRTHMTVDSTGSRSSSGRPSKKIQVIQEKATTPTRELDADGLLHLYALPVGQGNGLILQCPNGDIAIVDLGSASGKERGFWSTKEIKDFLQDHYMQIKNIVITHNDTDHYSFFKDVFPTSSDLPFLININISCTFDLLPHPLRTWITGIGAREKVRTFNGGHRCGHLKNEKCGKITLCPENPEVMAEVLSANAGGCEDPKEANIDSIVIGITFKEFKMHLSGDFEDCTPKQKNGPQRTMVNVYGDELNSTVYMLSHHGANRCANKEVMLDAVRPKAVFASSDPFIQNFRHPKCSITDYLTRKNYLCKPMDSSCGRHPMEDIILDYKLQQIFTCGEDPDGQRTVINNEYAIYSTTPSEDEMNLVHLMTDGDKWGFINGTQPRIRR